MILNVVIPSPSLVILTPISSASLRVNSARRNNPRISQYKCRDSSLAY